MRFILLCVLVLFPILGWSSQPKVSIKISGVNPTQEKSILANLSLYKSMTDNDLTKAKIVNLYQTGETEIITILESLGYYHSTVTSDYQYCDKDKTSKILYTIQLGLPIRIKCLDVRIVGAGQQLPSLQKTIKDTPLKNNSVLEHKIYETFKQNLLGQVLQAGYLDARFTQNQVLLDLVKNEARIYLRLETGLLYYFGKIDFIHPPYPADYLARYVPFNEGVPYTTERLVSLQKNLIDTDLFSKVKLNPDLEHIDHRAVPVDIALTAKPSNRYTTSLGFGTDSGPRGMIGWERRRKSFPGHRINMNLRKSKRLNQINAQYSILGKNPGTDRLSFGVQITEEKPSDKKYSLQNESGVIRTQKRGHFEQILALHYISVIYKKLPTDPKEQSRFILPSVGFTWSSIRKSDFLTRGLKATVNTRAGAKTLLSSTNILQVETRLHWIVPLTEDSRVLFKTNAGSIASNEFSKIPWNMRFFTGGDNTVRGFGYNSIGPREPDKDGNLIVVGGKYLIVGGIEVERKLYKNLSGALFVDTGNAMNHWGSRLKTGAGFGIRYQTPLGPLRLDIARPTMRGKHRPRVHLTFGIDF